RAAPRIVDELRQAFAYPTDGGGALGAQVEGEAAARIWRAIRAAAVVGEVMVERDAAGRQERGDLFPGLAVGDVDLAAQGVVVLAVEVAVLQAPAVRAADEAHRPGGFGDVGQRHPCREQVAPLFPDLPVVT